MTSAIDHLSSLRTLITRTIREQLGLHERLAVPLAEAILQGIQQRHGGREIYIPAPSRAAQVRAIQDARALGLSVTEICATLQVHRATVYRALREGVDS